MSLEKLKISICQKITEISSMRICKIGVSLVQYTDLVLSQVHKLNKLFKAVIF